MIYMIECSKRITIIVIIMVFLSSSLMITSRKTNMIKDLDDKLNSDYKGDPWVIEDEGDHYPQMCEWWFYQSVFELDNGEKWGAASTFQYETRETDDGIERKIQSFNQAGS